MKSRNVTYSLLFVLAVLGFAIFRKLQEPGRKEAFNPEPAKVLFTAYVLCRMDCYALSSADILLIMSKGVVLLNKSNRKSQPCPIYALQGHTATGRYIRVLFEQCRQGTRVVGCYDLRNQTACNCPVE